MYTTNLLSDNEPLITVGLDDDDTYITMNGDDDAIVYMSPESARLIGDALYTYARIAEDREAE